MISSIPHFLFVQIESFNNLIRVYEREIIFYNLNNLPVMESSKKVHVHF